MCPPKTFGVPLHLYIFFKTSSCSSVLFLGTLGLPDNFEDTGGVHWFSHPIYLYRDQNRLMKTVQFWTVRFHETSLLIVSLWIIS